MKDFSQILSRNVLNSVSMSTTPSKLVTTQTHRCHKSQMSQVFRGRAVATDCRNVHQSFCLYQRPSPMKCWRTWPYFPLHNCWPSNTFASKGPAHLASSPAWLSDTSYLGSWYNSWFVKPMNSCRNDQRASQGALSMFSTSSPGSRCIQVSVNPWLCVCVHTKTEVYLWILFIKFIKLCTRIPASLTDDLWAAKYSARPSCVNA